MSLPAPYSEVYLAGDGVSTVFAFGDNFDPISDTLVECKIYFPGGYETVPTFTVDMATRSITISALTQPDSTVLTAPPVGSVVRIYRDEPEAQNITASQLQSFTAKQLESALDAIVAMIQEVSYTVDHKTVRLTEPQRDIALQELSQLVDQHLIYWDFDSRKLVVTNFPQQDVVRCVNGLFFRLQTDPDTQEPYLQWSTDNSDWHGINVDAVNALAQSAYDLADDAYDLASTTRGELNAHKANHNNPHETTLTNLIDTDFSGVTAGQFIMYDGLHWTNVNSSATISWGTILGNIDDQTDLKNAFDNKVSTDGSSIMTGPLKMRATSSFQCAIAPYWDGVGFYKLNSNDSVTLIASIEDPDGFIPWTTNTYNIGSSLKKWKNLYLGGKLFVSTINNGGDLAVPAVSGTLATKADVDLAANSGRMITDQGLWYAKMYAATVAPSAADGTNYADFSQTDGQGNPIIVTYNRVNGAWVQDQTITPPADYDGYVSITSKIWDITEQAGQQGGRILWNHQSKEFTPYPQIISFEDIEITGNSTVIMPQNPSANQVVNKGYVDNAIGNGTITLTQSGNTMGTFTTNQSGDTTIALDGGSSYHPDLFDHKWADHILNDVQWLRADTFSWQSGSVYQAAYNHLVDDYEATKLYAWYRSGMGYVYTKSATPAVGDGVYDSTGTAMSTVETYDDDGGGWYITIAGDSTKYRRLQSYDFYLSQTETVGGITVQFYLADDGHKICPASEESNVAAIYSATGVAWYYVIDTTNERFKLPRRHSQQIVRSVKNADGSWYRLYADGWVEQGGVSEGLNTVVTLPVEMADTNYTLVCSGVYAVRTNTTGANWSSVSGDRTSTTTITLGQAGGFATMGWRVSGQSAIDMSSFQDSEKHLYFYVGEFTQTAIENTAGLNAELFNNKVDKGHQVIAFQAPTAENNYTWYRKYADGWVEQGGIISWAGASMGSGSTQKVATVSFPVQITKIVGLSLGDNGHFFNFHARNNSGTGMDVHASNQLPVSYTQAACEINWQVSGMAAQGA